MVAESPNIESDIATIDAVVSAWRYARESYRQRKNHQAMITSDLLLFLSCW